MRPIDQVFDLIVLVLLKIVFVTLCDVANISNIYIYIYIFIYELMNFVFVILCDVVNISNIYKLVLVFCDYFGFRFFFG